MPRGSLALPYETYKLALTDELLNVVLSERLTPEIRQDLDNADFSGYLSGRVLADRFPDLDTTGQYWIRSGIAGFGETPFDRFYLPDRYTDAFGNTTTLEYDEPYFLFPQRTTDPLGNQTEVLRFNYRVLATEEVRDPNQNLSEVAFDILGMPVAMAVKGKGAEGDSLGDVPLEIEGDRLIRFFTGENDEAEARELLGSATARHLYTFGEQPAVDGGLSYGSHPACAAGLVREVHVAAQDGAASPLQAGFEYSDGMGTVLVTKALAEGGLVTVREGDDLVEREFSRRWIATGKTILNNKGNPVKQYEPFFSPHHRWDSEEASQDVGVTPIHYYDAAGQQVRTELPDGTVNRVEFSPWFMAIWDGSDTIRDDGNEWYARRTDPDHPGYAQFNTPQNRQAVRLAEIHANTPAVTHLDSLGREVVAISHNKTPSNAREHQSLPLLDRPWLDEKYVTYTKLDIEGKPLWIQDALGNRVMEYITPAGVETGYAPCYDIAGNLLFQHSMDGGDRWMVLDATGQPFYAWDRNERVDEGGILVPENRVFHTTYDELRRPLEQQLRVNGGEIQVVERFIYGESQSEPEARNLRGQVYQHYDPSGVMTNQAFDFKGNLLETTRQLTQTYAAPVIDWNRDIPLAEVFTQRTEYDALGRMARLENWHRAERPPATYAPRYNQRGVLAGETLTVQGQVTEAILNIDYDAKGQRLRIDYGNNTSTRYTYDPKTFQLTRLITTRTGSSRVYQDLHYTYDPVGNITEIRDAAYEPVFFRNQRVEPRSRYEYDALYRLIEAEGREQYSNSGAPPQKLPNAPEVTFPVDLPTDPNALRNYTQHYGYDAVGNIMRMEHRAGDSGSWTRHYEYASDSNRLLRTWLGSRELDAVRCDYDTHGSLLNLANTPDDYRLRWDYRDMIHTANLGGGGQAFYNYDSGKQRTRKRIEHLGSRIEERLYLGGIELYRRWENGSLVEEIETHHLFVDDQRALIVEDVMRTNNPRLDPDVLFRYQYGNHLGSVALELDDEAAPISYEEYHPYGTTAYQARNRDINANAKRYRYTGMERDEETGLSYHTARYYLPWLGRWGSVDPIGIGDGVNLYGYCKGNPVIKNDTSGNQSDPCLDCNADSPSINPNHPVFFDSFLAYRAERSSMSQEDAVRNWRNYYNLDHFVEEFLREEDSERTVFQSLHYWIEEHYGISSGGNFRVHWALVPENIRGIYVMQGLIDRGLDAEAAAGIAGNLYHESRFLPSAIEGSHYITHGDGDLPTPMVNKRCFSPEEIMSRDGLPRPGVGLAQWTTAGRRSGLFTFEFGGAEFTQSGSSILFSLEAQIDYLISELGSGEILILNSLSIQGASDRFLSRHERPARIIHGLGGPNPIIINRTGNVAIPQTEIDDAIRVYDARVSSATRIYSEYGEFITRISN